MKVPELKYQIVKLVLFGERGIPLWRNAACLRRNVDVFCVSDDWAVSSTLIHRGETLSPANFVRLGFGKVMLFEQASGGIANALNTNV